jgi:hypothetical protein
VDDDLVFIVNYECPRCQAPLEARASGPPCWLRCPSCGRASLPPDHDQVFRPPIIDDDTFLIGSFTTGAKALPIRPRSMAPLPPSFAPRASSTRLLLGTGFFLSTVLFLFSLLESNHGLTGISGVAAVSCLILLSRRAGTGSRE